MHCNKIEETFSEDAIDLLKMSNFKRLINFQALEDGNGYFADLGHELPVPSWGTKLNAYSSFADFQKRSNEKTVTVKKVMSCDLKSEEFLV